jgi:hypothetical protein
VRVVLVCVQCLCFIFMKRVAASVMIVTVDDEFIDDFGSSEDDPGISGDESDDTSDTSDVEESDDANDISAGEEEDGFKVEVDAVAQKWRRSRTSSSTSGEWARLYAGLKTWHASLSDAKRSVTGPLVKPYRR